MTRRCRRCRAVRLLTIVSSHSHDGAATTAQSTPVPHAGRIAFSFEGDIWTMKADGSNRTRLTHSPTDDFSPSWSPDGSRIAFDTERDACPDGLVATSEDVCADGSAIYLIDATGANPRLITTPAPGGNRFPAWSPDGTRLAYTRSGNIVTANADGSDLRDLGPGSFPTWSSADSPVA